MTAWPPLLVLTMSTFFFSALMVNDNEEAAALGVFEESGRRDGEMERDDERE